MDFIFQQKVKKSSNDTAFQYSVDELEHCSLDMQMSVELVPSIFVFIFNIVDCYAML